MQNQVLIVAGEDSSDQIAADLVTHLNSKKAGLHFFGVGGPSLKKAGAEILINSSQLSIIGITQVLLQLRKLFSIRDQIVLEAKKRKPAMAILLDLPDFNLRLASKLKSLGIPIYYYISPQIWAWRRKRIFTIKALVEHMLVLYPFERDLYEAHEIPVTFVGHPLAAKARWKERERSQSEIQSAPRIGLFPGSRRSELKHHQQLLIEVVVSLRKKYPKVEFKIARAQSLPEGLFQAFQLLGVAVVPSIEETFEWSDISLLASGTITLENALAGIPAALFYRVNKINHFIFQYYVRYASFLGLPNVLLKKEVMKEFFQKKATSENLIEEVGRLIENPTERAQMRAKFLEIKGVLGNKNPSAAAAEVILKRL